MKAKQVAIAIDQLLNTLFGGFADETLSARAYRMSDKKRRWLIVQRWIDGVFFWQKYHCFNSYINEVKRKHLPKEYS